MDIPKYHETFIPILKTLDQNGVISVSELRELVLKNFYSNLPKELLEQKTKTGGVLILNRIDWGKAYLKQAEMVEQPKRAMVAITNKGHKILEKGSLSLKELLNDTDFLKNQKTNQDSNNIEKIDENASPQDLIDVGFKTIESQIKNELLNKIKQINPFYFEKVILILLEKMGYGDFEETSKSGDGGIDGIINQDKLGLEKIFVQAKRYKDNKIHETQIRDFIGAMSGDSKKGIFVTTSSFDEHAKQKAHDALQKIVLIDGNILVDLMYKYGVGVQIENTYEIKQIDEDFFEEN